MSTDAEIVRASLSEPWRFAELYERHARVIHRYAGRRLGVSAADDITSETFLVAFDKRATFDPTIGDARPWLLGIATVLTRKYRRLEARSWLAVQHGERDPTDHPLDDALERMDAGQQVAALASAIRRLSASDRDTLLLLAWGDLDHAGIAAALGIPVGTVKSRLNRIRRKLATPLPEQRTEGDIGWTA